MSDLLLPKLSLSMDEARIVSWLVSDGDAVRVGQPVATVETDKAEVDVEADADGVRILPKPYLVKDLAAALAQTLQPPGH